MIEGIQTGHEPVSNQNPVIAGRNPFGIWHDDPHPASVPARPSRTFSEDPEPRERSAGWRRRPSPMVLVEWVRDGRRWFGLCLRPANDFELLTAARGRL